MRMYTQATPSLSMLHAETLKSWELEQHDLGARLGISPAADEE